MVSNSHVRAKLFNWRTMKKPTSGLYRMNRKSAYRSFPLAETDSTQEPADLPNPTKLSRFTLILR